MLNINLQKNTPGSKIIFVLPLIIFSFACKNYQYHYFPLPVNQAATANKGEFQLGGSVGTSGGTVKSAYAITDKLVVAGQYNGPLAGEYTTHEGELALGWNTKKNEKGHVSTLFGGYGMGSNFKLDSGTTLKDFKGDFQLGFLQFGMASTQGHLGKIRAGSNWAVRLNYIDYMGYKALAPGYTPFNASNWYMDIYLGANIGGKRWRLEFGEGFIFKTDLRSLESPKKQVHIFPLSFNVGLQIILGRDYKD